MNRVGGVTLALALWAAAHPAAAQPSQDIPTIDTEDAVLGSAKVGAGDLRGTVTLDVRNGDYARGAYDDDGAGLSRLPVHAAASFAAVLNRDATGAGSLFLICQSSNGFHRPGDDERSAPRSWYESNTIVALAWRPRESLTTAVAYAIKASPNGVSGTTHETSLSASYQAESGLGWLKPTAVVTTRTRGTSGVFTLIGLSPEIELGATTVSIPLVSGIGWSGFYASGSGDRLYGSAGIALERGLARNVALRTEMLALVRDRRLRALDAPKGTTATIIPTATVAIVMKW